MIKTWDNGRKRKKYRKEWAVLGKHQIEEINWRRFLWRRPYKVETIWEMLAHLAAASPRGALVFEVRSQNGQVNYLLGAAGRYIKKVEAAIKAHGDIQFHAMDGSERMPVSNARQLKISRPVLSLKTDITQAVIRAGLAALAEDKSGTETAVVQIILGRGYAPSPVLANLSDPNATWLQVLLGDVQKASAENRKTIREKAEQHTFQAVIRIGAAGETASTRLQSIMSAFRVLESAGVRIREEEVKPSSLNTAHVPWHFPLQLSVKELANFLLLPVGEDELPGTPGLHPKLTLPPNWYRSPASQKTGRGFAVSLDAINPKRLSISPRDSLEHCHLIGPTGSGKSTAMLHLILADITAGRSVLVLDPKADLVNDVLERIPENRTGDVVIIDPSDPCPCGFNPLAFKDYGNPSLIADAVLSVLKEIFSDSWGIYTQDMLTSALLTLVETENATLLWLLPLLTDEHFRRKITSTVKDRMALRPFWEQFEALRDTEKKQQISPILNKLRQLTLRPGLRNILGQAKPKFSLTDLFYKRRIVLIPLNKGLNWRRISEIVGKSDYRLDVDIGFIAGWHPGRKIARGEDSMAEIETDGAVPEETPESSETTENSSMQETVQSDDTPGQLTVEVPSAGFTPETLENLKKIVASKKTVLEKALGAGGLPIIERDGRLIFPWFTLHGLDGEADAYSRLITAICKMAKQQKRVTAVERPVENAKFAMRLFLVRLGFIGEEYKTARKILLRNLTGNGSWKSGHRPERDTNAVIPPSPEDAALTAVQAFTAPLEEADAAENSLHKEDEGDDSYGK